MKKTYTGAGIALNEDLKVLTLVPFSRIGASMKLLQALGDKQGTTR
ncbi:hypothetical protein ACT3R7_03405 [Halomonas sp. AOP43-A1-21]|nr:hypothetical protein [Halomonas colorata]